jgi:hypothetical protein
MWKMKSKANNGAILAATALMGLWFALSPPPARAAETYVPRQVASIFIDGIDGDGPEQTGVFGVDIENDLVEDLAAMLGVPTGLENPAAPDQFAICDYYGDTAPGYYTAQDLADLAAADATYGGGVPRHAAIVAKFAREVLRRSGARQVNLMAGSLGALVGRWIIEKDLEGLASQGKIARFLTAEGVIGGNWAVSEGGQAALDLLEQLDQPTIDLEHMDYDWIEDNLGAPRRETANPLYASILVAHFTMTDDDLNEHALTVFSGEANDGLQIVPDTFFANMAPQARHFGLLPPHTYLFATHYSSKDHRGLHAAGVAALTGRRRARLILESARIDYANENFFQGDGEIVFECKVWSPEAERRFAIPGVEIAERGFEGRDAPMWSYADGQERTLEWVCFDGFLLPGENQLRVKIRPWEIDWEPLVYGVIEDPSDETDQLSKWEQTIAADHSYAIDLAPAETDWSGRLRVEIIEYPEFAVFTKTWSMVLY